MKPRINYSYTIGFKPVHSYDFIQYNDVVDETCYAHRVLPYLDRVITNLRNKPYSRQEVIVTNTSTNYACLISMQFLINTDWLNRDRLVLIANFRSQCRLNGRPADTEMLRYFSTIVMKALGLKRFVIYCNVANYHSNLGIENYYGRF
jgi:thymidylate synthase